MKGLKRVLTGLIVIGLVIGLAMGLYDLWWWLQSSEEQPISGGGEDISEAEIRVQDEVSQQAVFDEELTAVFETSDLSDPTVREQLAKQVRTQEEAIRAATHARAERMGIPIREEWEDGRVVEIQGFDGNVPIYFSTLNGEAAYASQAESIRNSSPYNVSGEGVTVGVWDGGKAYNRHSALGEKNVVIKDKAKKYSDHATHVTGTITADGRGAGALGMAPSSLVWSYDYNFDISEILLAGAGSEGEANRVSISNHSYGQLVGYEYGRYSGQYNWFGDELDQHSADYGAIKGDSKAGRYSDRARAIDTIGFSMPYLTSFFAAGNDRTHNPKHGNQVAGYMLGGSFEHDDFSDGIFRRGSFAFDSKKSPKGDGEWRNGFENIGGAAVAKNNIVVGAVDAKNGRLEAEMSTFSSWGPTDDGRIKPDIVAHGVDVNSTVAQDTYEIKSGTSMASPSAAGSAALLVELYQDKFKNRLMRSTTLKALLIHTADDLGRPGPDYTFGWGLINVKKAADVILKHEKFVNKSDPKAGAKLIRREVDADKEPFTFVFQSDGTQPIRATLCWLDPAGPLQAAADSRKSVLSHNLDLLITGPNGEVHRPFKMPYVGDWSLKKLTADATRGKNNTDNVEQIFDRKKPTLNGAGIYKVTVSLDGSLKKGFTQQPFSLVVTGGEALPKGEAVIDMDPVLNFGKVSDGRSRTLHLNIRNLGEEDLLITGFDFGSNLDMSGNFDGTIKPGGVEVVPVTYTPAAAAAEDMWFGTLKVLCNSKAGRITVPLAHTVKGKWNHSPQLLRPEPGVAIKTNHIDNLVGSEWSYDWKEESYTNRFAFNQDGTVRIIVVDNPSYRTGDVKAGMNWMPVGPNQVKLYNPGSFFSSGKYPNFEEAIMLKFTSAKTFETTSLNGKAIVGRRYGEPGKGEDFTKDLAGKLLHYIYHESRGDKIKNFSTNFEAVLALMQANGTLKPFQKEDVHGLWDNVTWKVSGTNVIRFYNASTKQELYMHLVASRYTAFKTYVAVGWNGNNVSGMLMKPWKTDKKPDDLTERHDREISGNFGRMEMEWRMPGQDAGMPGYWRASYAKITQRQWKSVMSTNPSSRKGDELPVDRLTWRDAKLWIIKMNAKYPLPAGRTWSTQPEYTNGAKDDVIAPGFRATIVPKG